MSLKIIFFPVALVIAIVVSIWFIKPEIGIINQNKAVLNAKNSALDNVKAKQQNIGSLVNDLNNNKEKEDIVVSYIAKERHEEDVLNKIYDLANQSRVAILNLALSESRDNNLSSNSSVQSHAPSVSEREYLPGDFSEDMTQNIQLKNISVSIEIMGEYEKIKDFLKNLYLIDRINNNKALSISTASSVDEEGNEAASNDNLVASIEAEFGYFPIGAVNKNSNLEVFSKPKFDFSPADKLIKIINKTSDVEAGVTGKNNPFISD